MRYVVLIHSDPQPWGHPTSHLTAAGRAVPAEERDARWKEFNAFVDGLAERGELVVAEALAEPGTATVLRWSDGAPVATDGPYAEAGEHLAGFFLLDLATPERAQEVAARFAAPGNTVEMRPAYIWPS